MLIKFNIISMLIMNSCIIPISVCLLYLFMYYYPSLLGLEVFMYMFIMSNYSMFMIVLIFLLTMILYLFMSSVVSPMMMGLFWGSFLLLFFSFMVGDMMQYYFMFESILFPMLMIILKYGYQTERMLASLYMLMYTFCASLPLLFMVCSLCNLLSSSFFTFWSTSIIGWMVFLFCVAFMVKLPMYPLHLWLPKAHVESPTVGSMILAGIVLKLGIYGMYQLTTILSFTLNYMFFLPIVLWSMFITSIICSIQLDIKSLIAYSSIVHMSVTLLLMIIYTPMSMSCVFLISFSHGLVSSCMFYLIGAISLFTLSRSIVVNKGMMVLLTSYSLIGGLVLLTNMSLPPSLGFVGEVMAGVHFMIYSKGIGILFGFGVFFSSSYSVILFSYMFHGSGLGFYSMSTINYMLVMMMMILMYYFSFSLSCYFVL